jgi:PHS family inorganic phosphate transporter-like MFS transporter
MSEREMFSDSDGTKLNLGHLKVWFTSGMGFFTDAYDLFIIGIVLILLEGSYGTSFQVGTGNGNVLVGAGLLASSAIVAAIFGQLVFGRLADIFGRKKVYGLAAAILASGALLSAFATSYWMLFAFRFLLGFGIGGDYPISATIMSEYSNKKDRGKMLAFVFANQGIGSVAAVLVGLFAVTVLPAELAWRFMLGAGAIPAAAVIYLRTKLPETPRYSALVNSDSTAANRAMNVVSPGAEIGVVAKTSVHTFSTFISNYWRTLIVTAGSWFILDMAFYGTGIYSGAFTGAILPSTTLFDRIFLAGMPFFAGFFGYFTAVALMDRVGRKPLQIFGFVMMFVVYTAVAAVLETSGSNVTGFLIPPYLALALYSLSFFFIDMGPNTTTFVVPAELYPVKYRATGHGISAASGKVGAAVTTFAFAALSASIGIKPLLIILAVTSLAGAGLSLLLKETKNLSLEEASEDRLVEEDPPSPSTTGNESGKSSTEL